MLRVGLVPELVEDSSELRPVTLLEVICRLTASFSQTLIAVRRIDFPGFYILKQMSFSNPPGGFAVAVQKALEAQDYKSISGICDEYELQVLWRSI